MVSMSKKNIDLVEKVQRRFTKRVRRLKYMPYSDRLAHLNLTSLNRVDWTLT